MLMTPKPRRVCVRDKDEDMHRGGGKRKKTPNNYILLAVKA